MSIFNIFKLKKKKPANYKALQASATLYPDKILVETTDKVKEGFGISSANVTILPIDTDSAVIGSTVRHHLSLTRTGLPIPKDYIQHYREFLKKAGFKTGKEHHRNALYLSISLRNHEIKIMPFSFPARILAIRQPLSPAFKISSYPKPLPQKTTMLFMWY